MKDFDFVTEAINVSVGLYVLLNYTGVMGKTSVKYVCLVILVLLSNVCSAQTFVYPKNDSVLTEYNDGKLWAYLNKNDVVVGLTCFEEKDDYGKYYQLNIFIKKYR